eukprot:CAMPEP_0179211250 /NCGR_PEP_ID=MMETSP0797-20121207/319_1 /TAXON_ID=47934 /ORGANISM="Dinophysis acuminata, Strain DAEP01" /LENGTH=116 /DNA_ID=CAMNT_0020916477 /DNA_START=435 /DNA_END=785 /DNA_ORIENTATION=+
MPNNASKLSLEIKRHAFVRGRANSAHDDVTLPQRQAIDVLAVGFDADTLPSEVALQHECVRQLLCVVCRQVDEIPASFAPKYRTDDPVLARLTVQMPLLPELVLRPDVEIDLLPLL